MHAGFANFSKEINQVMQLGIRTGARIPGTRNLKDRAGGRLMAKGMAVLLQAGFGYIMRDGLLNHREEKALAFFRENFVFTDPQAPGGERYYQGKFLIRTRKPGDDMNVYLRFCPDPEALFRDGELIESKVVATSVMTEEEADVLAQDPDKVDLVINFKDVESITGLLGRPNVDMTGLLLENLVQLTGNVGHLFKLGAIAKNVELSLDLPKAS